jgi:hypothetical protein
MMQQTMMARELQWLPAGATELRTVRVSVGLPEPHPTLGGYQCTLTVEGFGEAHSTAFQDADGTLALTYTLNMVPHVIEHLVEKAGGGRVISRLRVLEDEESALEAEREPLTMERELEYWPPGAAQSVPIRVLVGAPTLHSEKEWGCRITIEGFPDTPPYSKEMFGSDALQALAYALAIVPLHLRLMAKRGGRITWEGTEALRFPSMFSEPTADWQLTPSGGGEPRKLGIRIGLPERIDDRWSALVSCVDCTTWETAEKRVHADAWPEVLQQAAAAVPVLLHEYAEKLGGGALEEIHPAPACGIPGGPKSNTP